MVAPKDPTEQEVGERNAPQVISSQTDDGSCVCSYVTFTNVTCGGSKNVESSLSVVVGMATASKIFENIA